MSGVKLNWKAIFFSVIAFVFVFFIALATMASYVSGSIRNPDDKFAILRVNKKASWK